jgi:hypothetical protein
MIRINLLSEEEKNKRLINKKISLIVRLGFSMALALFLLAGVMLSALVILDINLKAVKEEMKVYPRGSAKEVEESENLLRSVDSISQKIVKDSQEVSYWGKTFRFISAISPEGVKITNIHIEKEHVRLNGFAKTREDFLSFQEGLRKDYFKNFNSPVSNLVSPENISFTVEFDVDKKYLNQP